MTNTVSSASSSASTTGPSGRSIATSLTPARRSRAINRRSPDAVWVTLKRSTGRPWSSTIATA
jgi:hypothetical protein